MRSEEISELRSRLRGQVIDSSDDSYDAARALYNGMIDKRPSLIVRCADAADIIAAVEFGRDCGLRVAIRGGGHNGPGLGSCDDGLVIDLSPMKGIRVDADERTVRAEAGCTQGDLTHALAAFGLAVPVGIVSTTGIAGLTLGGGHGYLARGYGLTIDNLLEVDVVLADGRLITASPEKNADLFWAVRGGGGNFGVVTSFVFKAHPVATVHGGPVFWDLDDAPEVMRAYRDFLPGAPREWGTFLGLKTVPSTAPFPEELWGRRICAMIVCYDGSKEEGERVMKPLRDSVPAPLLDWTGEMPLPALQSMFDPLLPEGYQWYWKGDFVTELTDEAIDTHVEHAAKSPTELSLMHLYPIDGAVHDVGASEAAWATRDAQFSMVIAGIDPDPGNADAITQWAKDYWSAVHAFNPGGAYVNFMMDDEGDARIQAAYGENYARLARIKAKYDAENFFRVNQNIRPSPDSAAG